MKLNGLLGNIRNTVFTRIDLKKATIKIKDGAGHEIEVSIGEGNLTWTEAKNIEYLLDRGNLDDVREGDQIPVDVNFDFIWDYLKGPSAASTASGGQPTISDALKQRGAASDWVSVDDDTCRPYAVDLEVTYEPTPKSCGDKETITLADFRHESLDHDLTAGSISCSGKCNITEATSVRETQ